MENGRMHNTHSALQKLCSTTLNLLSTNQRSRVSDAFATICEGVQGTPELVISSTRTKLSKFASIREGNQVGPAERKVL
jgi:hypothetical protein